MRILIVGEGAHEEGGALQAIVERVIGDGHACDFRRVAQANLHVHHGKTKGMEKKAIRWMLDARRDGYDGLVFLVDEDGYPTRVAEVERAQADATSDIRRAVGVAVRSFDAWVLADETAIAGALGCTVDRQPDPEGVSDPKGRCADLLRDSPTAIWPRDFYAAVLQRIDLAKLRERCPVGFAPFERRLSAM